MAIVAHVTLLQRRRIGELQQLARQRYEILDTKLAELVDQRLLELEAQRVEGSVASLLGARPGADEISEDCLTLNIWSGAWSADERRPVMVWIHGG